MAPAALENLALETATMRRVTIRIVPFLMHCYFIAFVERVNAGFAALQMNKDVGLSPAVFGLGGGIFFLAYFLFEVPSNLPSMVTIFWLSETALTGSEQERVAPSICTVQAPH